jgi:hypothetical protein
MKTLTVQQASQNLGGWLRRALGGEQIAIHEGAGTVLLQPLPTIPDSPKAEVLSAREALLRLQSQSRLSQKQAEDYLAEVWEERLMFKNG